MPVADLRAAEGGHAGQGQRRLCDEALGRVAKEPNNLNHYRSVAQAAEIPLALATGRMKDVTAAFLNHNGNLVW